MWNAVGHAYGCAGAKREDAENTKPLCLRGSVTSCAWWAEPGFGSVDGERATGLSSRRAHIDYVDPNARRACSARSSCSRRMML
jgi:hypothetical protein